jgi:hypothetical protein
VSPKILTAACIGAQIVLLAVSFNGLSATLGWGINLESPVHFDKEHRTTTAWAPVYFVCWLLSQATLLTLIFEQLARHRQRQPWLRVPSLGGLSDTRGSVFGHRLHQVLILLIFVAPLYAGGRFMLVTLRATVTCDAGKCWLDGFENGVQFFPPWESWAFGAGYFIVTLLWLTALWLLTRDTNNHIEAST